VAYSALLYGKRFGQECHEVLGLLRPGETRLNLEIGKIRVLCVGHDLNNAQSIALASSSSALCQPSMHYMSSTSQEVSSTTRLYSVCHCHASIAIRAQTH